MTAKNTKYTNYLYTIPKATVLFVEPKRLYIKQYESSSILVKNTSLIPDEDLQELNEHVHDDLQKEKIQDIQKDTSTHFKKPSAAEDTSKNTQTKELKQENKKETKTNLQTDVAKDTQKAIEKEAARDFKRSDTQKDIQIKEINEKKLAVKDTQQNIENKVKEDTVKTHIQKDYENDIYYYSPQESDDHVFLNDDCGRGKNTPTNQKQYIIVTRTDGSDSDKTLVTIHALAVDNSEDLSTSYYTGLTQEIGVTADGKKINFYLNPYHVTKCMEYCRNPNYVYWADIPKKDFDGKNYRQCVDYLFSRQKYLEEKAIKLLDKDHSHTVFDINEYIPVCMIGTGAFGYVLLVLKRVKNYVTLCAPYALKYQNTSEEGCRYKSLIRIGAMNEAYLYSKFEHPNILKMFNNYELGKWRIQAFEFLPYGTLRPLIKDSKYKTIPENWKKNRDFQSRKFLKFISAQLLMALEYIHGLDVIHFDLKPENIGIGYRGYLKLYDFGMSYPQKEILFLFNNIDVMEYGCKEKKDGVLKPTYIGTGTDVYAFSYIFLQLFGTLISGKYIPSGFASRERGLIKDLNDFKKVADMWTNEIIKLINANSSQWQLHKDIKRVLDDSFHFYDYKNRKTAKELLELDFYKDLNKVYLFKQKFDLEAELKIDLRDLFIAFNKGCLAKVFDRYSRPK